jgi:hypothetical protein
MTNRVKRSLRNNRCVLVSWLIFASLLALVVYFPGHSFAFQIRSFTSPETGRTVAGEFYDYWISHGGLTQFGHPISEEIVETTGDGRDHKVQYFERTVLVLDPTAKPPTDMSVLHLGELFFESRYKGHRPPNEQPSDDSQALSFPQTGKVVGGRFLKYWEAHGGRERQGVAISNEFDELNPADGSIYKVQYFENAVFEYHPENNPPYDVLLSTLGKQYYQDKYVTPHFNVLEDLAVQLQHLMQNNYVKDLILPIIFTLLVALFEVIATLVKGVSRGDDRYRIWRSMPSTAVASSAVAARRYRLEDHLSVDDVQRASDVVDIDRMLTFSFAQFGFLGVHLGTAAIAVDITTLINRVGKAELIAGVLVGHLLILVFILLLVMLCNRSYPWRQRSNNVLGVIAILVGFASIMFAFIVL